MDSSSKKLVKRTIINAIVSIIIMTAVICMIWYGNSFVVKVGITILAIMYMLTTVAYIIIIPLLWGVIEAIKEAVKSLDKSNT